MIDESPVLMCLGNRNANIRAAAYDGQWGLNDHGKIVPSSATPISKYSFFPFFVALGNSAGDLANTYPAW
jgi:hypothetical protein